MIHNAVATKRWTRAGAKVGAGSGSRRGNRRGLWPVLLALEDRRLLATLMVTNTSASGAGSLAQALADANANNQANTIQFGPLFNTPQTITLGGQLSLSDTTGTQTIAAPRAVATLNAGNSSDARTVCRGPRGASIAFAARFFRTSLISARSF